MMCRRKSFTLSLLHMLVLSITMIVHTVSAKNGYTRKEMQHALKVGATEFDVDRVISAAGWKRCSPRGVRVKESEIECEDGTTRVLSRSLWEYWICDSIAGEWKLRLEFMDLEGIGHLYKYCFYTDNNRTNNEKVKKDEYYCDSVVDLPLKCTETIDTIKYSSMRWKDNLKVLGKKGAGKSKKEFERSIYIGIPGKKLGKLQLNAKWQILPGKKKKYKIDTLDCGNVKRVIGDTTLLYLAKGGENSEMNFLYELRAYDGLFRLHRYAFIKGEADSIWARAEDYIDKIKFPNLENLCSKADSARYIYMNYLNDEVEN